MGRLVINQRQWTNRQDYSHNMHDVPLNVGTASKFFKIRKF